MLRFFATNTLLHFYKCFAFSLLSTFLTKKLSLYKKDLFSLFFMATTLIILKSAQGCSMKNLRRRLFPLIAILGVSSSYGVSPYDGNGALIDSYVFEGKKFNCVENVLAKGENSFKVLSERGDWMTETSFRYECFKMVAPSVFQDPVIHGRIINVRMDVKINPNRIPHKVDLFGWNVPSDCSRLKDLGINFDFGKPITDWGGIVFTSCDYALSDSKSHIGNMEPCNYTFEYISTQTNVINATTYNPYYFPLHFYTKNQSLGRVGLPVNRNEADSKQGLDVTCSKGGSVYSVKWEFDPTDNATNSEQAVEINRMYAENVEKCLTSGQYDRNEEAHPDKYTIRFYYSIAFGDEDYLSSLKMKVSNSAHVGYGVMGSAIERRSNESEAITIPLK